MERHNPSLFLEYLPNRRFDLSNEISTFLFDKSAETRTYDQLSLLMTIRLKEEAMAWNRVEAWFVFSYKLGPTYDVIVV